MTATLVRWARPTDKEFAFVSDRVPDDVVAGRIAKRCIAIAEQNGQPVGALQLEYLWGTKPYIALIRVHPTARRKGVGSALLEFVTTALWNEGHRELYSSSQADEAEPQAWHRHKGFTECGIISGLNDGGIGEIFFVRSLIR